MIVKHGLWNFGAKVNINTHTETRDAARHCDIQGNAKSEAPHLSVEVGHWDFHASTALHGPFLSVAAAAYDDGGVRRLTARVDVNVQTKREKGIRQPGEFYYNGAIGLEAQVIADGHTAAETWQDTLV